MDLKDVLWGGITTVISLAIYGYSRLKGQSATPTPIYERDGYKHLMSSSAMSNKFPTVKETERLLDEVDALVNGEKNYSTAAASNKVYDKYLKNNSK